MWPAALCAAWLCCTEFLGKGHLVAFVLDDILACIVWQQFVFKMFATGKCQCGCSWVGLMKDYLPVLKLANVWPAYEDLLRWMAPLFGASHEGLGWLT